MKSTSKLSAICLLPATIVSFLPLNAIPSKCDASGNKESSAIKNESDPNTRTIRVDIPGLASGAKPLDIVFIKAGTFNMGEEGHKIRIPRKVTLTRDYYIGKYEITQAQWKAVMKENPSEFRGKANYPVENVSWYDCVLFCNRLSKLKGLSPVYDEETWEADWKADGFRLPTEAEWEYACRAGSSTHFYFGDVLSIDDPNSYDHRLADQHMWWEGNNEPVGTKEVGLKLPNLWGLYDMHGNVDEWCHDKWERWVKTTPLVDPKGDHASPRTRCFKGGCWARNFGKSKYCRAAKCGNGAPGAHDIFIGFRIAKSHSN